MSRFQGSRRAVIALAAVVALLVGSELGLNQFGPNRDKSKDFDFFVYYFAAQAVLDNPHSDLYKGATNRNPTLVEVPDDNDMAQHARSEGFSVVYQYIYPPLLADMLQPLARISPYRAAAVWRAFNLIVVFLALLPLRRLLRVRLMSFEFATLVLCAFSFFPIDETLHYGQISIAMFALWAVGICAYRDGKPRLSAAVLALATIIKITPILSVPVMLIWKDRRWLVSYFSVLTGLVVFMGFYNGLETSASFLTVMTHMTSGNPVISNKSIASVATWIYYGKAFDGRSVVDVISRSAPVLTLATRAVSLAICASALYLLWRNRTCRDCDSRAIALAVFALLVLCVSPVSWRHAYAVAFIPLALSWADALRRQQGLWHLALLVLTSVSIGTVYLDAGSDFIPNQPLKILMCAMPVLCAVLLSLYTLAHPERGKPPVISQAGEDAQEDQGVPSPPSLLPARK
jgi:hypothetical protein